MPISAVVGAVAIVALLAEGVDRNNIYTSACILCPAVALLAEGVDRNRFLGFIYRLTPGRPPRGGRG